ncbi:MAG: extracellular solute-binding protein [Oscillospiraceae bacterium]|nr:extracellular solute-binding protein [Oscillospiraceae bacterium]
MNKTLKRTFYIVLIAFFALVTAITSIGCGGKSDDPQLPDYVYLPNILPFPLPEGIEWINNVTTTEDAIYFTAHADVTDEATPFHAESIYKMDFNSSSVTVLPNYNVDAEFPAEADDGSVQMFSLFVDRDGNVWVAERGEFFTMPESDDDEEDPWELWNRRRIVKEFLRVRKLDSTGAEISSFDIKHISTGDEWFYIYAFSVDSEDNIYIGTDSKIHVLASDGKPLFNIDVPWVEGLINMHDGSVAYTSWADKGRVITKIDAAAKKPGETIQLPNNANNVYRGNDEYSFIFTDNIGLYGIEAESGNIVSLLKWIDSDIILDGLGSVTVLSDGRILLTSQIWNNEGSNHELIFLTKTPYTDIPEREVLTLATFYLDWNIRGAVVQFNRTSTTHRIHVTDYAEFGTDDDWGAGLTRLSAEITAGNVPDILDVSNLPFSQYAAKGLLLDLYPLIDADPDYSRSDFMEAALRATEIDGSLYKIFPYFSIATFIGNPAVVGSYPGWNMEEFVAVLNANPDADFPLGQGLTRMAVLQALFMFNMNEYVDWNEGKVYFDSDEFIGLLEYAKTLPDDFDWNDDYISEPALISSGRQIISAIALNDFHDYQMYRALYGGEIVFKGIPAESKNGFSLTSHTNFAITAKCKDANAAWSFIRTFLSENWYNDSSRYGTPINRHAFEKQLNEAMKESEHGHGSVGWDGITIELEALTQADADKIMAMINSITGSIGEDEVLWEIISESVSAFFNGQSTAQDVARIIQNRASTYVSERS